MASLVVRTGLAYLAVQVALASVDWPGSCQSTDTADDVIAGIDLSGKVIIISGADGNIAGEVSLALAKKKATLILACRTLAKCEDVRKRIIDTAHVSNTSVEVEQLDLSSRVNIVDFVNRTTAKHPRIDVLINSAGTYGTFMTHDRLVGAMEVNLLGPALLSQMLLPALRGGSGRARGRVVNVAAATYGTVLAKNTTVADLAALCTAVDPILNKTGSYFGYSKYLMTHHAKELAQREPTVTAFAVNPGVAVLPPSSFPNWLKKGAIRAPYPKWFLNLLPQGFQRYVMACTTNLAGYDSCPETFSQSAGVVVSATAWPGIDSFSGSYLDFDTSPLPPGAPQVYGPWTQKEPTCTPRQPPPMDAALRSAWYDEMLRLMKGAETGAVDQNSQVKSPTMPQVKTSKAPDDFFA